MGSDICATTTTTTTRPDLTILNGPVVSYDWFESHRRLYPDVVFPGTHMVGANTQVRQVGVQGGWRSICLRSTFRGA